jgi:hypothetical protein
MADNGGLQMMHLPKLSVFFLWFADFVVTLALPKVLSFGKTQINLVFLSLIRIAGSAEGTHVLKNSNKFGFSLTYSYLCTVFRACACKHARKYYVLGKKRTTKKSTI